VQTTNTVKLVNSLGAFIVGVDLYTIAPIIRHEVLDKGLPNLFITGTVMPVKHTV
jgi:ABC-type antimicrobial peptide transport system permease subunit